MRSVLVIGCGSIGERHVRCFQRTGRAQPTACDENPTILANMAKTYQVATFSNWEEALDRQTYDAVIVCTPAHLHVPMAIKVLQRGCHVLIEKPLSPSLAGIMTCGAPVISPAGRRRWPTCSTSTRCWARPATFWSAVNSAPCFTAAS